MPVLLASLLKVLVKLFLLVEATCQPFSEEVIFFFFQHFGLLPEMLYRLDFA